MSKRLIGIEIGTRTLRIAILNKEKGQVTVNSLVAREFSTPEELALRLRDLFSGEFHLGDRIVTSLPTRSAYVRRLKFPFQNESKISAAIPFELSAQLPVSIESCATAAQKAHHDGESAEVLVAAVPTVSIELLLDVFETANIPLHHIDLAPFCHVASLGEQLEEGVLICSTEQDVTLASVKNGQLQDYRVLPPVSATEMASGLSPLLREARLLSRAIESDEPLIHLMGSENTDGLAKAIQDAGFHVEVLSLAFEGQVVDAEFTPAVALALRAQTSRPDESFNFRRGQYKLKGEWANLKGKLILLAVLLGLSVLVLISSMTLKYLDKSGQAKQMQSEMVDVYRGLFPDATTIVDVPLQLRSAIRELQEKGNLLSSSASTLAVLKEVSSVPGVSNIEVQEIAVDENEVRLAGWSVSFESVNQVAKTLAESQVFSEAQVTDSKMSLDGSRVDFRLLLTLAGKEGE